MRWIVPVLARALFSQVDPNPNELNLQAGVEAYRQGNHDGVIAFGGGSGLDLGKVVAFMAGQTRPVWDFEDVDDWWTRADVRGYCANHCGADNRWNRIRSWASRGHYQLANSRQKNHFPSQNHALNCYLRSQS